MTEEQLTEPTEKPPPPPPPPHTEDTNQYEYDPNQPQRVLERRPDGAVAGVASGLAYHFRVKTVYVQLAFGVLTIFGGSGILLYIAGIVLIPVAGSGEKSILAKRRPGESIPLKAFSGVLIAVIGGVLFFENVNEGNGPGSMISVVLIGVGLWFLNQRQSDGELAAGYPLAPATFGPPDPRRTATYSTLPVPPSLPPPDATQRYEASEQRQHWTPNQRQHWTPNQQQHWATPKTHEPKKREPQPPIVSITILSAAIVGGLLVALNLLTIDVEAKLFFGLITAILGAGIVVSSFKGRALSLIPLALLSLVCLSLSPLADRTIGGGFGTKRVLISNINNLETNYEVGFGAIEMDLTSLEPGGTKEVDIKVGAGHAEIQLPENRNVQIQADSNAGYVNLFGREVEGLYVLSSAGDDSEDSDVLTLNIDVEFGYVEVNRE